MQADDTAVLIVKVHGRNTASEYRPAHATISLRADGKPPLRSAARGGLVDHGVSKYGSHASMQTRTVGSLSAPHNSRPSKRTVYSQ